MKVNPLPGLEKQVEAVRFDTRSGEFGVLLGGKWFKPQEPGAIVTIEFDTTGRITSWEQEIEVHWDSRPWSNPS